MPEESILEVRTILTDLFIDHSLKNNNYKETNHY